MWHFNVTKDLNALIKVRTACRNVYVNFCIFKHVKEEHSCWDGGSYFQFKFDEQMLQLELEKENLHEGWKILPSVHPCVVQSLVLIDNCVVSYIRVLWMTGRIPHHHAAK